MPLTQATLVTPTGEPLPDPHTTRVDAQGWMRGFPPPADKRIAFDERPGHGPFPRSRWSFSHMRELVPTANVWRGPGPARALPVAAQPIDPAGVRFEAMLSGESADFAEMLLHTYTDSVVVLHRGEVVYEGYWGEGRPERPHICFSITKSFVGTLAASLAAEGALDVNARVPHYLPEMAGTAYADATLRDVMDMRIGVQYSEDYTDPDAEVRAYARAGGMAPRGPDYVGPGSFYDFLRTLRKQGEHGAGFAYKTINTEVLAWVLRRITGQPLAELVSQRIWQPMGAEHDAYFMVDAIGTEGGGGGLNCTVRDLARFGELMRNGGRVGETSVVPAAAVAEIAAGGSPEAFAQSGYTMLKGWSYRDMWWVTHNAHGAYMGRGIHGQSLYVDPQAEMVIARFAAHPVASSVGNDPVTLPAFHAMAQALMARG
jgi:CubicO group peptidase (beta-lactamase class C family)